MRGDSDSKEASFFILQGSVLKRETNTFTLECFFFVVYISYLMSPGRPTDIGLQLGKACYPCSRLG